MCIAVAACATLPEAPPRGRTQELTIRTDPPGAACSILQGGVVAASVTATPGVAVIPRRNLSIEVVCRRDGYLEARMTFAVVPATEVELEAGTRPWRPPRSVGGFAADFVGDLAVQGAVAFFPPAIFGLAALGAAAGAVQDDPNPPYAYRALPEFLLTPESFASEANRDAFFANLQARLEAATRAQHAYIDAHCRFWPCEPTDVACPNPVCEYQGALVDERLKAQLEQIPALRAQTRVVP
jgi:hypothetical protein